ncbi:MAG: DUF1566 domain-containing protein [Dissulfurispiraceae bacterium]|jgi:hypothetical protein
MSVKSSNLITGFLACLLLLSFASVLYAWDVTFKDGVIDDPELGLQWAPAPDRTMDHYQAEEYARNLTLAGGGWRLPTLFELKSLYNQIKKVQKGYSPDIKKFNVSDKLVWTSELAGNQRDRAKALNFFNGWEQSPFSDNADNPTMCVLAVRPLR